MPWGRSGVVDPKAVHTLLQPEAGDTGVEGEILSVGFVEPEKPDAIRGVRPAEGIAEKRKRGC